jgi:diguanylate cyclase (GGDEF)-like protein
MQRELDRPADRTVRFAVESPAAAAYQDPLTGLVDRHQFTRRLQEILSDPDPDRRSVTAFALNLDSFRTLNTLHGFRVGDEALKIVAERLVSCTRSRDPGEMGAAVRERDMVARLGGDEFGIICGPPALSQAEAQAVAARLPRVIAAPIAIGGQSLRLTAGTGFVTTIPVHREADDVLRDLDLALRQAKALGSGKAIAWEPALTRAAMRRCTLADEVRRAVDDGELLLHYQPILQLSDMRMVGAEALLRWNHPREGLVTSASFLPILEETGLIVEVGSWVIREAVRQIESWRRLYGRDIVDWVSVNLSARQFDDPASLLATLRGIYGSGFSLRRLRLEITETGFMRNPDMTRAVLAQLDALGIQIAIDDFGTGYSSLNSLRNYPVDTIKIDAEFISQIGTASGEKLAQALLNIARTYDAAIVAEGIETVAQRDFLAARGCGYGQGYLFSEPMDGALLGAYALTRAVSADPAPAGRTPPDGRVNPPASKNRLRAV